MGFDHYSKIPPQALSKSINVLYLSYDGLTDPLGQSQILPYLIGLSNKEYRFTIISFEKKKIFEERSEEIEFLCQKNEIVWIPLKYHKRPPVLSTLFDLMKLWGKVKMLHHQKDIHIIHCRSYLTSLVGLRAKKKWHIKFIFDMRGFWADERVEGGLWNLRNPMYSLVYKFFKKKEHQFLREADHIISLTHNAKKEIEEWGSGSAPITVIPTCVDLDLFDPLKIKMEDQVQLRSKLGIDEEDFVLLYLGSWGTWYLTEEMLNFFTVLKQYRTNAKFLIVSGDPVNLSGYSLKRDVILTSSARSLVPAHILISNVSICFIKPGYSKKASSATKLAEILAMNVPVITNKGWGDVDQMFPQENKDHLTNDFSHKSYQEVILKLINGELSLMRGRTENYSLTSGVLSYLDIYSRLCR